MLVLVAVAVGVGATVKLALALYPPRDVDVGMNCEDVTVYSDPFNPTSIVGLGAFNSVFEAFTEE